MSSRLLDILDSIGRKLIKESEHDSNRPSVARSVKALREHFGDSQQAFSNRLGLSMRAIANYEKDRIPTKKILEALSRLATQAGRQDLANDFLTILAEQMGPFGPAPPWITKYPIYALTYEWALLACVQRIIMDPKFAHLLRPVLTLLQPVYEKLIEEGKVNDKEFSDLLDELAKVEEALYGRPATQEEIAALITLADERDEKKP